MILMTLFPFEFPFGWLAVIVLV